MLFLDMNEMSEEKKNGYVVIQYLTIYCEPAVEKHQHHFLTDS
jgi:hypothetical protein